MTSAELKTLTLEQKLDLLLKGTGMVQDDEKALKDGELGEAFYTAHIKRKMFKKQIKNRK